MFASQRAKPQGGTTDAEEDGEGELAGGFQRDDDEEASKPLPPWMIKTSDIRSDVQEQRARDIELNAEDRARALEEERIFQRDHGVIEVESSDDESDIELLDARPVKQKAIDLTVNDFQPSQSVLRREGLESARDLAEDIRAVASTDRNATSTTAKSRT